MEPIILASSSPRRQEILSNLQIPFKVMVSNIDETQPEGIALEKMPEYFASKKVEAVVKMIPSSQAIPWVFGADTMVIKDDKAYGKPQDIDDARKMLETFSGTTHSVITSIALFNGKNNYLSTRTCVSNVTFAELSSEDATIVGPGYYEIALGETKVVDVIVTAVNGATKTYKVKITRDAWNGEHTTKLSSLHLYDVNIGDLVPPFNGLRYNYTIDLINIYLF